MPKVKKFNIDDYNDTAYRNLLIKALEKKAKSVTLYGASLKSINFSIWDIKISDEDFNTFKNSKKAKDLLLAEYEMSLKNKKQKYDSLKAKCDFCLHDVKPYKKLLQSIDEFTYCGATDELEAFQKRYMFSKGYTKAIYRARLQEFNKVGCV